MSHLDKLSSWSNTWQLKFDAQKCKFMHIGHPCRTECYMTEGLSGKLESVQEQRQQRQTKYQN